MFPAQRQGLAQLEQQLQQARAEASSYSASESVKLDFASYSSRLEGAPFVKAVEEAYGKISFPPPVAKTESTQDQAADKKWAEQVQEMSLKSALKSLETRAEIEFMEKNRFDKDTTFAEVKQRYPEIFAEVEEDMQRGRIFKDLVPGF